MAGSKGKGKRLDGAPRSARWTRRGKDVNPSAASATRNGALVLLLTITVLTVGGLGSFAWMMWKRLDAGLLAQREEARRRADWVRIDELPRFIPDAFAAVVDTSSFERVPPEERSRGPMLSRDLVRQVHRLGSGGLGGEARELVMTPLLENSMSRRGLFELYLNRISLGRTGDWPVFGIHHGAREYFGKDARRMTLGEAATLAGILLAPRLETPEASPGAVGARRNEVLRRMLEAGKIDEGALRAAAAEPLAFQPGADYTPMARPIGWDQPPQVIQLPQELRPSLQPDSAQQAAAASQGGA
jgi:membrane peptidoglycan carboxypeptidase